MTRESVLNDTIATYNSNNRCTLPNGDCQYHLEGKLGCAVGRLIADKELCNRLDNNATGTSVMSADIWKELPEEIKKLGQDFLSALQGLHDQAEFWQEDGLSDNGKMRVNEIRRMYL